MNPDIKTMALGSGAIATSAADVPIGDGGAIFNPADVLGRGIQNSIVHVKIGVLLTAGAGSAVQVALALIRADGSSEEVLGTRLAWNKATPSRLDSPRWTAVLLRGATQGFRLVGHATGANPGTCQAATLLLRRVPA